MEVGPGKLRTKDIQAIKALMNAGDLPVQDIADRFCFAINALSKWGGSRVA
jgi:hypothetical protein